MKEEQLNTLRQQDNALREALRQDEAELPQMPADLNARLMERMAQQKPVAKSKRLWPWVAAACVAAFIIVNIMPPRKSPDAVEQLPTAKLDAQPLPSLPLELCSLATEGTQEGEGCPKGGVGSVTSTPPRTELLTPPLTPPLQGRGVAAHTIAQQATGVAAHTTAQQTRGVAAHTTAQQARGKTARSKALRQSSPDTHVTPTTETSEADVAVVEMPPALQQEKPVTLTERDIPITRPENYQYTPEELALLKKQADEAYLKWVELELEIAKHHLEQTAQQ